MRNEDEIRRLLRTGMDDDQTSSRPLLAASRARRQVGQRDGPAEPGRVYHQLATEIFGDALKNE